MLKEGMAWAYMGQKKHYKLQNKAKAQKKGLWGKK